MTEKQLDSFVQAYFGTTLKVFLHALEISSSARGYIAGAISELLLAQYVDEKGFNVKRIVEKPSGGFRAKIEDARGDFYIRRKDKKDDEWFVTECKGLKTNAEFRGAVLDKNRLFRFLKPLAFHPPNYREIIYKRGLLTYERVKKEWENKNRGKTFPPFRWKVENAGPVACDLNGLWKNEADLREWINSFPSSAFTEEAYRQLEGPIAILMTHKPNRRVAPITGINQAAPLITEFSILAIDLFLRTGKHQFVFVNPEDISHSPTSPEHLYQNYTIDILVKKKKPNIEIVRPWYLDIDQCIEETNAKPRKLEESQVDHKSKKLLLNLFT